MDIKENVNYVKEELSGDEKVLEKVLKLETFFKKHKINLISIAGALVLFFAGQGIVGAMHDAEIESANKAFLTLQTNPGDQGALDTLKEDNPALYELYSYQQAMNKQDVETLNRLSKSENKVVADASRYALGALQKRGSDSKLYRDMVLLEEAYLAIEEGKSVEAKTKLELIDERSPVSQIARLLNHATIKVK